MGDLYSVTPWRQRPLPVRAGDGIGLGLGAGGPLARDLEHVGPAGEHGHEEVAVLHVRQAQDPGLLGDVQPGQGVEGVRVGSGDFLVRRGRILPQLGELANRRLLPSGAATLVITRRVISMVTSG